MTTENRKYPYFEKGLLLPRWKLKPEPAHCIAVDVEEFYLSTDRPPPKLRDQPPSPASAKTTACAEAPAQKPHRGLSGFQRVVEYAIAAEAGTSPSGGAAEKASRSTV